MYKVRNSPDNENKAVFSKTTLKEYDKGASLTPQKNIPAHTETISPPVPLKKKYQKQTQHTHTPKNLSQRILVSSKSSLKDLPSKGKQ